MVCLTKEDQERKTLKIQVCDHTKICNIYLPITNKNKFKSGDFIRIRSGSFIESSITKIRLEEYSNILMIPLSKTTEKIEKLIRISNNPFILLNYYISQNMLNGKTVTKIIDYHGLKSMEVLNKNISETLMNNKFIIIKGNLVQVEMNSIKSKSMQMMDNEENKNNENHFENNNEFKFGINVTNSPPVFASTLNCPEFFDQFFKLIKGSGKQYKNVDKKIFSLLNRLVKESKCLMELLIFKQGDEIYVKDTILNIEF